MQANHVKSWLSQLSAPLHCPGNAVQTGREMLRAIELSFSELNTCSTSPQPGLLAYACPFYTAETNFC